ncbi:MULTISPECIES: D-2-hydroxyacid dehydrogenase family protein [Bradyrhizobium]|jgi:phosphoglycerate dehydrogenase-like enzyme|uniref:D-2-hydroxyacid dehydrogenase family protein n=1 Tax=Bradyrhizobium TaxID=374 RepID=UPI00048089E0|nr:MULTISPECIES: D-2-hydroxyacid dehydrogenase family protein [Bradyrhizobium]MCS3446828.1 D-3-phosphoglycerate dehydrogenase [Bradyrhizobium elkanii]MCS3562038.1 D-3-phosphoglycerate dehydrogenase [Bradyrhizobium elkanii]MCW2148124.1 D-3-phosphoglycerate dehydrogenase [Bradyrhizobium elkanii]MCW2352792.1 D-3-phosphoglycerate dehydrogenase [Bradyrhizobium elkanii]MCW2371850.1 D-3-phosphoglycerate dehydrogenase [Bradyrhizobium elkanii]
MTRLRCAILDDYFDIALSVADWPKVKDRVDVTVFDKPFASEAEAATKLKDFEIICAMRERTPFPKSLLDALPRLQLLITSGMRNAAIDMEAAKERKVVLYGTQYSRDPTAPLTMGLILELTRGIGRENARMHAGEAWQTFAGTEIEGKTLGIIGLGKLGSKVAGMAKVFGMNVIAWSPNLTPEKCNEAGVGYASKDELFATSDIITIHVVLSPRSRGLVGAADLARMKPSAYLVNTARGPIVDEDALFAALRDKTIAGAGIDVFSVEPLPSDHPLRKLDNVVITPHLGYATRESLQAHYQQMVECIDAFSKGSEPPRPLA